MNHMDYIEAGLKVFGLHPIIKGQCDKVSIAKVMSAMSTMMDIYQERRR